ncbi:MAG: 1-acyl-sn-glycerol-3-phosphate acyltransferase [Pseudomonadales bacterium]|jgi:glycerol-3-phosphate O-acyltransferase|nr:1-acyl-sn-glycerol-3-phosphate acyltransferase [Pseudomonadales bacterium]
MHIFDDIRPYHDGEVRGVVNRLVADLALSRAMAKFRFPLWYRVAPGLISRVVQAGLRRELNDVYDVKDVQIVIEKYLDKLIEKTAEGLTHSGLDQLDPVLPYLFISNHRDITMDPALVNYMLYHEGFDTLQIAIGDNLLKRPFLTDLMKLNKSFLVKRGLQGRELLAASKQLSAYISHCIATGQNVWIAQREGRAKDGVDKTEPAVIKMLYMQGRGSEPKLPLAEAMNRLNIVPVAISYELDPCDAAKAAELHAIDTRGCYTKDENTDVNSILTGMVGKKGAVHVSFGAPLSVHEEVATTDAVAAQIDAQIVANYRLHLINYLALQKLQPDCMDFATLPARFGVSEALVQQKRELLLARLRPLDAALHPYVLRMYANPVLNQVALNGAQHGVQR